MGSFSIQSAKERIREVVAQSELPEDLPHADNTLQWLLRLEPDADVALQLAALAHDVERAVKLRKVRADGFADYDAFKAAHARNSAAIVREIMAECRIPEDLCREVCRLVRCHEEGGDPRSDLLREADTVSYFEVNLKFYYERNGRSEALRRTAWGYRKLSARTRAIVRSMVYGREDLDALLQEAVRQADDAGISSGR